MKTNALKSHYLIFVIIFINFSINIFAQGTVEPLPIYGSILNLNKIYQQGATVQLGDNDDIRVYSSANHQNCH